MIAMYSYVDLVRSMHACMKEMKKCSILFLARQYHLRTCIAASYIADQETTTCVCTYRYMCEREEGFWDLSKIFQRRIKDLSCIRLSVRSSVRPSVLS